MMANKKVKKHSNNTNNSRRKNFKRNDVKVNHQHQEKVTAITYREGITVNDLALKLHCNSSDIIKLLFMLSKMVTINSQLDDETVELVCLEYGVEATKVDEEEGESLVDEEYDDPALLKDRPPIVTIMGHVDHGKTTLLDAIRKTKVVEGEFGGITQHIGAYQVKVNDRPVTFLDTPGHEAFTAMRARGAKVTDVSIIVVAADDGVMPQTKEAVDHSKAADVPIIVAVNKMDKPDANPERVKSEMSELGLIPEDWGGDTIYVECSAKKGEGIKDILETILVVSEVKELKANPDKMASGSVIEARLDKGRGPVVTLLIQNGTLKQGDAIVCGACFGRIRKMVNDMGEELKEASPSTPVEIIGLQEVPVAGDLFKAFESEKEARIIGERRLRAKIERERHKSSAMSLDDLSSQIESGEVKEIPVIVKTDVAGTAEAVASSLAKIDVDGVKVNVIRAQAGAISESDVMLASASKAVIYGFNVRPDGNVRKKASEEGVDIRLHNIIYKAVEEMEAAMKGMLEPVYEEQVIGQAEVRKIYKVSKVGTIAGCMVTDGKLVRECKVRLIRNGIIVYEGRLNSLKRFENDAKEVANGFECGLTIENYNDIKENDIIEGYEDVEVKQD